MRPLVCCGRGRSRGRLSALTRCLVIIPTFNEVANAALVIEAVLAELPEADVLVVDDASPDGTGQLIERLRRLEPRLHVLHRPAKLGLGSAYVAGFSWGLSRPYAAFVQMDADFSHDPKYLPHLLSALSLGADVAIGSRNIRGGAVLGWGPLRHLLSKGGSLYARRVLGLDARDMTAGFKAYTRRALELIRIDSLRSNGYAFQIETTFRAIERGLVVQEIPIVFVDRRAGHSKLGGSDVLEAVVRVLTLLRARL